VGLLIDSTLLVHAERNHLTPEQLFEDVIARWGDIELAISVMSAGELFHGCWRADSAARRARREEFVEAVLSAVPTVPVTLEVMRVFGEVDAGLSASGSRLPTSDLIIGCTALCRDDAVATANARHFERIPGLAVLRVE
jgi:predicted nucleic acid-binding protein